MLKFSTFFCLLLTTTFFIGCVQPADNTVTPNNSNNTGNNSGGNNNNNTTTTGAPVALFSFPSGSFTAPCDVQFTNASTGSNLTYSWTFGSGVLSTAKNPTHRYNNPGIYDIILKVTNSAGVISTLKKTITINAPITTPRTKAGVLNVTINSFPDNIDILSYIEYNAFNAAGQNVGYSSTLNFSGNSSHANLPILMNQNGSSLVYNTNLQEDIKIKMTCYDGLGNPILKEFYVKPVNVQPVNNSYYSNSVFTTPDGWKFTTQLKWQ